MPPNAEHRNGGIHPKHFNAEFMPDIVLAIFKPP